MSDEREPPRQRDPTGRLGRNLEAFLLFELLRQPSYGYELIRRLAEYGFSRATTDRAVVYTMLRSLEENAAVRSTWATLEAGRPRRYYEITDEGEALLRHRARQLRRNSDRIEQLLTAYEEMTGDDLAASAGDDDQKQPGLLLVGGERRRR